MHIYIHACMYTHVHIPTCVYMWTHMPLISDSDRRVPADWSLPRVENYVQVYMYVHTYMCVHI